MLLPLGLDTYLPSHLLSSRKLTLKVWTEEAGSMKDNRRIQAMGKNPRKKVNYRSWEGECRWGYQA